MSFNKEEFKDVVKQAINLIQKKGCFSLEDAAKAASALSDMENRDHLNLLVNTIITAQNLSPFSLKDAGILGEYISRYEEELKKEKEGPKLEEVKETN